MVYWEIVQDNKNRKTNAIFVISRAKRGIWFWHVTAPSPSPSTTDRGLERQFFSPAVDATRDATRKMRTTEKVIT